MSEQAKSLKSLPEIGIVGIGNPLRSDDGIASKICSIIEEQDWPYVSVFCVQQLQTELIEYLLPFDILVFVDASFDGANIHFSPLRKSTLSSSSHHMSPEVLISLAQQLYGKKWDVRICAVKGFCFEIGNQLSPGAFSNVNNAVRYLKTWTENGCL